MSAKISVIIPAIELLMILYTNHNGEVIKDNFLATDAYLVRIENVEDTIPITGKTSTIKSVYTVPFGKDIFLSSVKFITYAKQDKNINTYNQSTLSAQFLPRLTNTIALNKLIAFNTAPIKAPSKKKCTINIPDAINCIVTIPRCFLH